MPAFIVFTREHTRDQVELDRYAASVGATFTGHAATRLAAYGQLERLEGAAPEGAVILQFPDTAAARTWYHSSAYQEAVKHRHLGADYRAFIVEGA